MNAPPAQDQLFITPASPSRNHASPFRRKSPGVGIAGDAQPVFAEIAGLVDAFWRKNLYSRCIAGPGTKTGEIRQLSIFCMSPFFSLYRHLRGKGAAVDVVIVTPEEVRLYRDSPYLVIHPALREGKVVYGVH